MTRQSMRWAAAAAVTLAAGCAKAASQEPPPVLPVKTAAVSPAPAPSGVRYSATIEPDQQVAVAFKASGYVEQVLTRRGADGRVRPLQAGDVVARGAVLARVRDAEARDRVAQAHARLADGEAALTKARLDLDRARILFDADSLIRPDLDAANAAYGGAEARVQAARAEVLLAERAVADCALVAPSGGVVLERRVEAGTLAAPGVVGFVIGEVGTVKARFGVPDAMVASVGIGAALEVTVDAVAATGFAGYVTAVAPAADAQTRVFMVEVAIDNRGGRLRPGMIGTVAVAPAATAVPGGPALTVPLTAVVRDGASAGFAVFVVERRGGGAVAHRRPVRLGDVLGNGIAVTDGVSAGEAVVVSGATLLRDGAAVRVIE